MVRMIEKERIRWCYSFNTSSKWLTAIKADLSGSKHTEREYCRALKVFSEWIGKNPDKLITERKDQVKNEETKEEAEDKLRAFCLWLEEDHKVTKSTVVKYHAAIKSFYRVNKAPLDLPTPKHATRERDAHTEKQIKDLLAISDVREKAFILFLKDSGMSREDIVTLKYRDIAEEFEAEKDVISIKTIRKKESIGYTTFIGKNAIEALKVYLEYRKRKGEQITEDTPLLATVDGLPLNPEALSAIFGRLSKKVGFKTSPHRLRKFFMSHLGTTVPTLMIKYWMGHSIGVEKAYFPYAPEKQREKYREAYREIDLYKTELSELDLRKRLLIDQIMLLKPDVDRKGLENMLAKVRTNEELSELILSRRLEQAKKCEDDGCQKIVEEQELESWITQGWKFVATLPSGKIVVSNE